MLQHQPLELARARRQTLLRFDVAVVERHGDVAQIDQRDLRAGVADRFRAQPDQLLVPRVRSGWRRRRRGFVGGHSERGVVVRVRGTITNGAQQRSVLTRAPPACTQLSCRALVNGRDPPSHAPLKQLRRSPCHSAADALISTWSSTPVSRPRPLRRRGGRAARPTKRCSTPTRRPSSRRPKRSSPAVVKIDVQAQGAHAARRARPPAAAPASSSRPTA